MLRTIARYLVLLLPILHAATASQAQDPAPASAEEDRPSQETDVNEDNYRRFMELRDEQVQRPSQPYAVLAPPGNLEKMGKLPEESQKHLRNQLRTIILENGRWTPAEAGKEYPLAPSAAAETDAQLRNMEADAWSELVQNYHAREAEIYEAASRARAAAAGGATGAEQSAGASSEAGLTTAAAAAAPGAPGSAAPGQASAGGRPSERQAGVTQSAMEYLAVQAGQESGSPGEPVSESSARAPGAKPSDATRQTDATDPAAGPAGEAADAASQTAQAASQAASAESSAAAQTASLAQGEATAPQDGSTPPGQAEAREEVVYRSEGVIAIRDLDKLKGVTEPEPEKPEPPEDDGT